MHTAPVLLFAGKRKGDTAALKRNTETAAAFTLGVNEDDFMKADHGELKNSQLSVFLLGLSLKRPSTALYMTRESINT